MAFKKPCFGMALLALLPLTATAELGGDVASVQTDQSRLKAMRRATPSNGYTVHELSTDSGIQIREYASAAGKVFAVTWRGPFLPDLQQLLGAYFPAFKAAAQSHRDGGARGPVSVEQQDLIVQSGGRLRAFNGRAWVPSLLPPQVSIEEIQ